MDPRSFETQILLTELGKLVKFTSWNSLGPEGKAFLLKVKDLVNESNARLYENSGGQYGAPHLGNGEVV